MIKELIFSGKKFYEGQMPYYVGKKFKSPANPITKYTTSTEEFNYITKTNDSLIPKGPIVAQAQGNLEGKDEVFLMGGEAFHYYWVTLNDILQNGGVSASYMTTLCSHREELVA